MPPFDIAVSSHVSVAILLHLHTFQIHFLQNVIKLSWNNKLTIELRTLYSSRTVSVIMMMMSGSGHQSSLDKSYLPFTQHRSSETQAWSMSWPEPGSCDKVIIRCWSELECWDRGRVLHHLSADSGVRTAPAAACSNPAVPSSSSRDKWTVLSSRDVLILWYRAHTTFCSINNALPTSCLFAPSKVIMYDFLSLL